MWPAALDVLTAMALLAHAALVPAGAGVVAALVVARRDSAPAAVGHPDGLRVAWLRHLASTGQLDRSTPPSYDATGPLPGVPLPQTTPAGTSSGTDLTSVPARRWLHLAAVCTAASGLVHAAAGPHHAAEHPAFGAFFVLVAFLQFGWTARALLAPGPELLRHAVALNVALVGLWATTRTLGLPFGLMAHHEEIGSWDLAATGWELGAALCCLALLRRHPGRPGPPRLAVPLLVVASAVLLLALALTGAPE